MYADMVTRRGSSPAHFIDMISSNAARQGRLGDLDVGVADDRRPLGKLVLDELCRSFRRGVRRGNGGVALEELDGRGVCQYLAARLVERVDHLSRHAGGTEDETEGVGLVARYARLDHGRDLRGGRCRLLIA